MRRGRRADFKTIWTATLQTVWDDLPDDERGRFARATWEKEFRRKLTPYVEGGRTEAWIAEDDTGAFLGYLLLGEDETLGEAARIASAAVISAALMMSSWSASRARSMGGFGGRCSTLTCKGVAKFCGSRLVAALCGRLRSLPVTAATWRCSGSPVRAATCGCWRVFEDMDPGRLTSRGPESPHVQDLLRRMNFPP